MAAINFDAIPQELKDRHQWVLWKIINRRGKPTKVPFQINGIEADSTDPLKWASYAEVVEVYNKGGYDGIGYTFDPLDPYSGTDFDHCINGSINPKVKERLDKINSYSEISQSGKGIKTLQKAKLPVRVVKDDGKLQQGFNYKKPDLGYEFEVYYGDRFFALTGNRLDDYPTTIEDRNKELTEIFKEIFKDRPYWDSNNGDGDGKSGNGPREDDEEEPLSADVKDRLQKLFLEDPSFKARLFDPDVKDRSQQEHYLCARMWEAGFTEVEIYQIMESSPQTKWSEREDNYKWSTIRNAISAAKANQKKTSKEAKDSKTTSNINPDKDKDKPKESAATVLVNLAMRGSELWHTPDQESYITFKWFGHKEHHPLRSKAVKTWLIKLFFDKKSKAPGGQAIKDALAVLESMALYDGQKREVYVRVGGYEDRIYVDLGDDTWRVVEITKEGWKIVDEAPVRFWRPKGMLPLPEPTKGGKWNDLRDIINAKDDRNWILAIAWVMQAYWTRGPYAHINFNGEQGSGKSLMQRILKETVDPSATPLRRPPKDERDLMIAARNERIPSFDNLSGMPEHLSDTICGLSTGIATATRELYTDGEEFSLSARRPCAMNGIDTLTTRGDLLDRTTVIDVPKIDKADRKLEKKILAKFKTIQPQILGLILNATATGLKNEDVTECEDLPRMADFCTWVMACESSLPWEPGAFIKEYRNAATEALELLVESDLVARAIYEMVLQYNQIKTTPFSGTTTELLDRLNEFKGIEQNHIPKGWPRTAGALGARIRRFAPALRALNVVIEKDRDMTSRKLTISMTTS